MRPIDVAPAAVTEHALRLRRLADDLSGECLVGQPASCGDASAVAAVSAMLATVSDVTTVLAGTLRELASAVDTAARVYDHVESGLAGG